MKTEFELLIKTNDAKVDSGAKAIITNGYGKRNTIVHFDFGYGESNRYFIKHDDVERFAVNILKALKSKKLK